MKDIDTDHLEVERKYRTPKDLSDMTAKELLDGLNLETAAEVLDEYFGKHQYEEGKWTDWRTSSITEYGQLSAEELLVNRIGADTGDNVQVQVRHQAEQVVKEYELGEDLTRVSIGKGGREELRVPKGTKVRYRLRKKVREDE